MSDPPSPDIGAPWGMSGSSETIRTSDDLDAFVVKIKDTSSARTGFDDFLNSDAAILLTDAMFLYLSILSQTKLFQVTP